MERSEVLSVCGEPQIVYGPDRVWEYRAPAGRPKVDIWFDEEGRVEYAYFEADD
jgi:hypothetical protein